MTSYEKSAITGLWRMGNDFATIGAIFGIGAEYVQLIVREFSHYKHIGNSFPKEYPKSL